MGRSIARLGLAALTLAAAACTSDGSASPGRTVPTEPLPAPTTTSTTVASFDVPAVIDQAYVQRVVQAYDKVLGDAIRLLVRERAVTDEFLKYLLGIYTEPQWDRQKNAWLELVSRGDLEKRPAMPGDPVTSVGPVIRADPVCVIAEVDRDFRPTLRPEVEPSESSQPDYVVLVRKREERDPLSVNLTPWVMAFDGYRLDGSVPMNSCDD